MRSSKTFRKIQHAPVEQTEEEKLASAKNLGDYALTSLTKNYQTLLRELTQDKYDLECKLKEKENFINSQRKLFLKDLHRLENQVKAKMEGID